MLQLAVREKDYVKADSLYRKGPTHIDTLQFKLLQAYKTGDKRERQRILDAYDKSKTIAPVVGGYNVLRSTNDPTLFNRYVAKVTAMKSTFTPAYQRRLPTYLTAGYIEQGQVRNALHALGPLTPEQHLDQINRLINTPFYELPKETLIELRDRLLRYDSISSGTTPDDILKPHMRLYNLALVSCRLRDYPAARAYSKRLQTLSGPGVWARSVHDLGVLVDAQVDIQNARANEGLQKLARMQRFPPLDIAQLMRGTAPRFMWRAEGLYQAGRYQEALRLFTNMDMVFAANTPQLAYRLVRTAQIHDAMRNYEQARLMYSQFLTMFENADPEMQGVVAQIRKRLAELQRSAG